MKSVTPKFDHRGTVVFAEEPTLVWRVRCQSERYVVLTRPAQGESSHAELNGTLVLTIVDIQQKIRCRSYVVPEAVKCEKLLAETEAEGLAGVESFPLSILPPRKTNKMITLRITAAEHASLSQQAVDAGLSVNTYLLRQLGITVPDDGTKPRGRKPKTAAGEA